MLLKLISLTYSLSINNMLESQGRRRVIGEHAISVVSGRYQVNTDYPPYDDSLPRAPPTPEA